MATAWRRGPGGGALKAWIRLAPRPQVHPAPGPEEVNWQHLWLTWRQRDLRALLTWPLLLAVVVFPITLFTSAVAQLQYVLCPLQQTAPASAATRLSGAVRGVWSERAAGGGSSVRPAPQQHGQGERGGSSLAC